METDEEVALIPHDPGDRDLRIRETTISRGGKGNRSAKVASQGALCPFLNRNFRPDRPQLRVVPTAPEAVSYGWLQRRNGGWFWAMLLGVLFGGLILFFTNWLSR